MNLCPYCYEQVSNVPINGDDSLEFCDQCERIVEGKTITHKTTAEFINGWNSINRFAWSTGGRV